MAKTEDNPIIQTEQLNSINKILSTLAFALIVIVGIRYIAKDLLAPVLLAVFIAVLLSPLFRFFRRRGFSSRISLVLMIVTFFAGTTVLVIFLTWSFGLLAESLNAYVANFKEAFTQTASSVNVDSSTAKSVANSISPESVQAIFKTIVNSLGNIVFYFVIVPILAILLVLQFDSMPKDVASQLEKENASIKKFKKFADSMTLYVFSRLKVNVVTGILFAISLIILGVDFPFVWGFLAIIMSFIPYIGIIIASAPPVILAFTTNGITGAVLVIVAMLLINFFAENVLAPTIQGKDNKLSTAVVFISFIFFAWLLGPVGAILSVPLTVFLKIVLADFKETRWIALVMEGNYEEGKEKGSPFYTKYLKKAASVVPSRKIKLL